MSSLANPNWLAVGAALFALCGSVLLAKAYLHSDIKSSDPEARRRADACRQVSTRFGVPILGIAIFLHAVSQMVTSTLTPLMAAAVLGLAFVMLIYAALEDSMIDTLMGEKDAVKQPARLALLPPAQTTDAREAIIEPMVAQVAH